MKDTSVIAIALIGFFAVMFVFAIKPDDKTDKKCPPLRDYQIELHMDTVWIYDGERLVDKYINTTWNSQLDTIIMKDNL